MDPVQDHGFRELVLDVTATGRGFVGPVRIGAHRLLVRTQTRRQVRATYVGNVLCLANATFPSHVRIAQEERVPIKTSD